MVIASSTSVTTTRSTTEQDIPFLYELFKTRRDWEMSLVDWRDEQKEAFLQQQFNAQRTQYAATYPGGENDIILLNGRPIGRIYTAFLEENIHLLDIVLIPEFRSQGIGSFYLRRLQEEARQANQSLRFYVLQYNTAALRFYQRHNCNIIEEKGAHYLMEWKAK